MLTNRCEKKHVVLLINQKDYVHYNQQTSTNKIRFTRYASRSDRTSAQKNLFMQNKPNFSDTKINVSTAITMDYVNIRLHSRFKNKPNSKPIKPKYAENKPNQTQFQTAWEKVKSQK